MARDTLLVTGSRGWTDPEPIKRWLGLVMAQTNIRRLVHGGARGADTLADIVWRELGGTVEAYPVDEAIDGPWPRAGHNRNERMVRREQKRIARALAFTTPTRAGMTAGTANCVARCLGAGIVVTVVPDQTGFG